MKSTELLKVVESAIRVIDAKAILEFAGGITFYHGKLFAGNDKVFVLTTLDESLDCSDLVCTVDAKDLRTVLSSIKSGEATITQGETTLQIKSDKVKAELAISSTNASIQWLEKSGLTQQHPWHSLPTDFFEGISWCIQSVSNDISYRGVTCIKIIDNRMLSTDKFRISRFVMSGGMNCDILLPKEAAVIIIKFNGLTEFTIVGDSWICFKNPVDQMICGARLVVAPFPMQIESFLDKEGDTVQLPGELKDMIGRVSEFVEALTDDLKRATIKITSTKLTCEGKKQSGNFEQATDTVYEGDPLSFVIIPDLFKKLLDITNNITVGEKTLSFKLPNFEHVLIANIG